MAINKTDHNDHNDHVQNAPALLVPGTCKVAGIVSGVLAILGVAGLITNMIEIALRKSTYRFLWVGVDAAISLACDQIPMTCPYLK